MNQNLCNNCGGEYEYRNGRWICRACGAYRPEDISNEEVTLLYTAYQQLRLANFGESEKEFDDIIEKYPQNPNAYWGRLMARFGIKYEKDFDGRMIPTCYATSIESFLTASDYKKALEYADGDTGAYYRSQAEYIERVRREWVEKASREKPYDIFICYKNSDKEKGIDRTEDSIAAQDLYIHLTNKGYRVFYSHESLRDKVGEKYEPYIFNALSTAKIMLVYGSKPEYITSTWLKNEWTRYEKRIRAGEKHPDSLLVACEGFSPSELPGELSSRQCFNASAKSFYGDMDERIEKILHPKDDVGTDVFSAPEKKKKSRAPILAALFALLAAAAVFLGIYLSSSGAGAGGGTSSVTNADHQATVVIHDGELPKKTEFSVEQVSADERIEAMLADMDVNRESCRLYDMELRSDGNPLNISGNVTVTLPIPDGITEKNAVVYYMSDARPQKISSQVSGGKITFVTNHFSIYMIAEDTSACEHDIVTDPAVGATCTETGLTEGSHCALCGKVFVSQQTVPAEHKLSEPDCERGQYCVFCMEVFTEPGHSFITDAVLPTCTEAGYTRVYCEICDTVEREEHSDPLGHQYKEESRVEPTCEENGYIRHVCEVCDTVWEEIFAEPLGHRPSDGASCTEPCTCTVCGELISSENGHVPGAEATCTEPQTCLVCGETLAPARGHAYETSVTEPTCTESGYTTYTCPSCGDSYTADEMPARGHTPGADATCTEPSSCIVCGEMISSASGHMPGSEATCTEPQTCMICGETIVGAKGHTPGADATCTEPSSCTVCGELISSANGHMPGAEATCTEPQKCIVCQTVLSPVIPHPYAATVSEPTCTEAGYTTYTCKLCGDSYTADETPARGHTPGADATCTEPSSCTVCGEQISSANGHMPGAEATCTTSQDCLVCGTVIEAALGHREVEDPAVPPTKTQDGLTAGSHCSVCGEVQKPQNIVHATGSLGLAFKENGGTYTLIGMGEATDTDIHIPAYYNGMPVTAIGEEAFAEQSAIRSITIPETVTSIGIRAFYGCTGLTELEIPASVAEIGTQIFFRCENLKTLTYHSPYSNRDNPFIQTSAVTKVIFSGETVPEAILWEAVEVTEIVIEDGVTEIGSGAFYGCRSLTGVTIGNGVKTVGAMAFQSCHKLASVKLGTSVEELYSEAFANCPALREIALPASLTSIGSHTFSECTALAAVSIGDRVERIGDYAFENCTALAQIVIPGSVSEICESAFRGCTSLRTVTLERGVRTLGYRVFRDCTALGEITLPNTVSSMGEYVFYGCTGLQTAVLSDALPAIPGHTFDGCTALTRAEIPESVTKIGASAFHGCLSLKTVTVPRSIKTIDANAFVGCYRLTEVINLSELTLTPGAQGNGNVAYYAAEVHGGESKLFALGDFLFYPLDGTYILVEYTGNATDAVLPDAVNGSTYRIGAHAFYNRSDLTSAVIPKGVTQIGENAFAGCTSLVSMQIPFVGASADATESSPSTLFGYLFGTKYAEGTTETSQNYVNMIGGYCSYYIPDSLTTVTVTGGKLLYGAFYGCTGLQNVTLGADVTSIGEKAFYGCTSLVGVTVEGSPSEIGDYAFYGCERLTGFVIPDGVTAIGKGAFTLCKGLTEIAVPASVTVIGEGAFGGCAGLTKMTLPFVGGSKDATEGNETTVLGYIFGKDGYEGCESTNQNTFTVYYIPTALTSVTVTGGNILQYAFYNCRNLKTVVLPDGLTAIGAHAFAGCTALESIVIPDGVTKIGDGAFSSCASLASVKLSSELQEIGAEAFYRCEALTEITIPDQVTAIGNYAFAECALLANVTLGTGLCSIGDFAFSGCPSLSEITVPDSVTVMGGNAFEGCTGLTTITLPFVGNSPEGDISTQFSYIFGSTVPESMRTVKVTGTVIPSKAFRYCATLTSIVLSEDLTAIGDYAFEGCTGLTEIKIPASVGTIGIYAFYGCTGLTEINLPAHLETVENSVFAGCTGLAEITIPDSVSEIGPYAFLDCTALASVKLTGGLEIIGEGAFRNCASLTEITIPDSVSEIGAYAFSGCIELANAVFGNGVKSIGMNAFDGCVKLTEITIPDNVETIGHAAFCGCSGLTKITVPFVGASAGDTEANADYLFGYIFGANSFEGATGLRQECGPSVSYHYYIPNSLTSVTVTGGKLRYGAFSNYTWLESVSLAQGVTEIGEKAFYDCSALASATIPESVTKIGNAAFAGCETLTEITVPGSVTRIGESAFSGCSALENITVSEGVQTIGAYAFSGCRALTEIIIPDSVTSIGEGALSGCISLADLTVPFIGETADASQSVKSVFGHFFGTGYSYTGGTDISQHYAPSSYQYYCIPNSISSVTVTGGSIPYGAFYNCTMLTRVTLEGVTAIDDYAFANCENLTEISLPADLETVGDNAFYRCLALTQIRYGATTAQWKQISFDANWDEHTGDYTVDCSDGTVSSDGTVTLN